MELVVVEIDRCRTVALGGGGAGVETGCDGCLGGCGAGTVMWSVLARRSRGCSVGRQWVWVAAQ